MCKNKFYVCNYSTVWFTLRFVNLFFEVSPVCSVPTRYADRRRARQTSAELSTMARNAKFCPKIRIFGLFEFLDFKYLILVGSFLRKFLDFKAKISKQKKTFFRNKLNQKKTKSYFLKKINPKMFKICLIQYRYMLYIYVFI